MHNGNAQFRSAQQIAAAVNAGKVGARVLTQATLHHIAARDPEIGACTAVHGDTALAAADRIDAMVAERRHAGPLAGVAVVVKNLFDVSGSVTLAGARGRLGAAPATRDATLVARLRAAGAIVVAATNMDEYAYGFTTENAHFGTTRNPRDPAYLAGGSSGGSAAAVAAGMAHIGLGSDTNGSVRIPAAYCGVFGMKPTFGRLSRAGAFPFVASFDHTGHLARSVEDLALAYDIMQGPDNRDPACVDRDVEPSLPQLAQPFAGLRIGVLEGWFHRGADAVTLATLEEVAAALGASARVELAESDIARAAAYIITASEGGNLHRLSLTRWPASFDPACRDRLLAGLLVPAALVLQAQRFRRRFAATAHRLFRDFDVLLAPATPSSALRIGETLFDLEGRKVNARAHIGIYTQPLSYIGLPVVVAPIARAGAMPVGIQIVAAPWKEHLALRVAARLEQLGLASAVVAE